VYIYIVMHVVFVFLWDDCSIS